jgi:hypothetical protein
VTERIDISATWRGDELLDRADWELVLSPGEIDELLAAVAGSQRRGVAVEDIDRDGFLLPTLGSRLASLQDSLETGSGAALIRGLPIDRLDEAGSRRLFWGIARHIGTPVSQSAKGERIFSVRDEGFGASDPRTRGPNTSKRLSFHTDRCDVIGFFCLRQAKSGGESFVVSSATLFNEILERRADFLDVLMERFYYKRHNVDTANGRSYCEQPIFSFEAGHFAASLLRVLIDRAYAMPELPDMTGKQREALDYIEELAGDATLHVRFLQRPGDILFLNNWVTLHRRSQFVDHDDPELRRHLLRIWLSVPNSRPLHADFKANYGATEAGALRGGMRATT